MTEKYDADYFLRGKQTGKSLYEDYRWMPQLTVPMAAAIVNHLGINQSQSIVDFGCARGYTVRALIEMGYDAWGYDISQWAIENADVGIKHRLIFNESTLYGAGFDWIIAKDVLEHVDDVSCEVSKLMAATRRGVFAVVPLSACDLSPYVIAEYEADVTHIHRLTLASWVAMFVRPGWTVECSYRVRGIKDNYAQYPTGNGFITARRIPC